jgi:hypothetical protein
MKNLKIRKVAAVLQGLAFGALVALSGNIPALPGKYQLPAMILVGALQGVMPSPVTRRKEDAAPDGQSN